MRKSCFSMAILITLSQFIYGQSPIIDLPQDTRVTIMTDFFSAHRTQIGQQIDFQVADEVRSGSTIVISRGARVIGEVVEIHKNLFGRVDQLGIRLLYVPAGSGERIPLHICRHGQIDWNIDVVRGVVPRGLEATSYVSRDMQLLLTAPTAPDHPSAASPASLRPVVSQ